MKTVIDYGAVGDGFGDDTNAIQLAIDSQDEIHFPDVSLCYRITRPILVGGSNLKGGKKLIGHRPCRGGGPVNRPSLIQAHFPQPAFQAIGDTLQNRAIELVGLSATNIGGPVLALESGIDALIDGCYFQSSVNTDATVRLRNSYNVTIRESMITCSGGGFAITAYNQCNKLRIQNNRITGGSLGGAIHVEQSSNVQIEGNLTEVGKYGIVVCSGIRLDNPANRPVDGAGVCHAISIRSNYLENVEHPMVIASAMDLGGNLGMCVFGADITANMIGTYDFDNPLITIGRLSSAVIHGNSLWGKKGGNACAIYATIAPGALNDVFNNCVIECNQLTNISGYLNCKVSPYPRNRVVPKL